MKNYLPIGSIVMLRGGNKKIMIYGRKQISAETKRQFDYVGCYYPDGNISPEYNFMFNIEDVDKIYFRGYSDIEEEIMFNKLNETPTQQI